jgi:hypothetical protein
VPGRNSRASAKGAVRSETPADAVPVGTVHAHRPTIRTEPQVSDPIPAPARRKATEAAAPEDEPPAAASSSFTQGGER